MKKVLISMLIIVIGLFAGIFLLKKFIFEEEKSIIQKKVSQLTTVSATQAKKSTWQTILKSTGNLRAVKGVNVTTELGGMVFEVDFKPGSDVVKGQVLAKLDIRPDVAKLHELESNAHLAKITYFRDKKQFQFGAISKQQLDDAEAQYKSTADLVLEQKATIDKKIIKAPFAGRLGISLIYPGQYLSPGQAVVTLQTLNPIYVDFYLPQQEISLIHTGQKIKMTLDAFPNQTFQGVITTVNPIVDVDIRNVEVEATLSNPNYKLLPGMFSNVSFDVGEEKEYITLPYLAVTYNPYGSLVYRLTKTDKKYKGKTVWQAVQMFVKTGSTRGDQIAVLKGLKVGDWVVTSGQVKLRNNMLVVINNSVQPPDSSTEKVPERD